MKTVLNLACICMLLSFISCTSDQSQEVQDRETIKPLTLKTLQLSDPQSKAKIELQITNPELLFLTEDLVTIKAENLEESSLETIQDIQEHTSDEQNEGNWTDSDIYVNELQLDPSYNSINIKIDYPEQRVGERGCKDPITFYSSGACKFAEPEIWGRTSGFYGRPRNCNHTDWEWKRKRWWGYKKLYDKDSYSSSTTIGYNSSVKHDAYQLRIDPNRSCCFTPSIIDFNYVYSYYYNSSCN